MRTFSIKQKLMLITMCSSTIALLLVAAALLIYEFTTYRAMMVRDLSTLAQITGSQSTAALTYGDKDSANEILRALSAKKGIVAAGLYTPQSVFVEQYNTPEKNAQKVPGRPGVDGWSFAGNQLALFRHIELNGQTIGAIYLRSDSQVLYDRLWHYTLTFLLFMAVSLFVTYLFASRLQRIISRPIFQLAQTAGIVSTGKNYSVRAQKESDDELGQLIDGFNEMLGQIQRRDSALKSANDGLEKRVEERTHDLQQQFSRISLLNQITYAVADRQDFASIVLVVLQQLEDHLPIDYGSAYLFDAQTEMLTTLARGLKSQAIAEQLQIPQDIPLSHTLLRPCLKGEMVYVPDAGKLDLLMPQKMANAGFHTIIATPLTEEGKMFGVLVLQRRQKDGFSAAEREFVRGLSAHVALAIHQAQLYQDLHKAYDDLRQTQQAVMRQERLKALGQMASGVAHDINNALSPIVLCSDMIQRGKSCLTGEDKTHLDYIKTAGNDIAQIVARMREFYRSRDEKESLLPLSLNNLVEQAVGMTRPRWRDMSQKRGIVIEMRTELAPRLPKLAGIESEMREMLTNLIFNAVDALPDGGIITIRSRILDPPSSVVPGEITRQVALEVSDTGIGMDEATRQHCLEPFFSTKGQRGTGLGLAMVYGMVERHEGKIEIDSLPGKGTTMRMIFPVREIETTGTTEFLRDTPAKPLHILCIDDEPKLCELLQKIFQRDGHRAEVAEGGRAGIEAFRAARHRNEPFDVIFTDLGMPYVDGREVAATVKRESPGTSVVMLTGWGSFMKEDGSAPTEIDGLLGKPPQIKEIRAMLRTISSKSENNVMV